VYKLEIIVREEKVAEVVDTLENLGYAGVTIYPVEGRGRQKGLVEQFRGRKYEIPFLPKTKIEVLIRDDDYRRVVDAVMEVARTDKAGDGKIFVYPVSEVVRIRTGETGEAAL
jgi:nitrogen regulatory protein P-II 1